MPYCVNCGTKISDDARFCPNCGKPNANNDANQKDEQNTKTQPSNSPMANTSNLKQRTNTGWFNKFEFWWSTVLTVIAIVLIPIGIVMGCKNVEGIRSLVSTLIVGLGAGALIVASLPGKTRGGSWLAVIVAMAGCVLSFVAALFIPKLFPDPSSVTVHKILIIGCSVVAFLMAIIKLCRATDKRRR